MAFELPVELVSFPANAALVTAQASASVQFKFAAVDSNGAVGLVGTAGNPSIGVLQSVPAFAGDAVSVMAAGISKVVASAAIAKGASVASTATGTAVTYSTGTALGTALTAAAAAGEIISVQLGAI